MSLKIKHRISKYKVISLAVLLVLFSAPLVISDPCDVEYNYNATGSIDRNVNEKMMETISVKDFGAVANGITDDTTAIQNAINYLQNSGKGGYVLLPPGKYKVTSHLTISGDGITLIGQGQTVKTSIVKAAAIYNANNSDDAIVVTGDFSGVENMLIYNRDDVSGPPTAGYGISINSCEGAFVRSVYFAETYSAIEVYESRNIELYDIDISEMAGPIGINISGSSSNLSKGIVLRRIKAGMLDTETNANSVWLKIADYTEDVEVENGRFVRGGNAILITSASPTVGYPKNIRTYKAGTDNTNREGYRIETGSDITLTNTWIGQVAQTDGIYIGSGFKGNFTLYNSYVRSSYYHGINILGGTNICLTNCSIGQNNISNGGYDGVHIGNGVGNVNIAGCKIGDLYGGGANRQRYGVFIDGSSHQDISIQASDVRGNNSGGIVDQSSSSSSKYIRNNIGADNPFDGTLGFNQSGTISTGRYLVQWVYGNKIKISQISAKTSSGSCTIYVSVDGVATGGPVAVVSGGTTVSLISPIEIDATSAAKRIEVYVSSSSASDLELGYGYINML